MIHGHVILLGALSLRPFTHPDVTGPYVEWLNAPRVNQFIESRTIRQTDKTVKKWVDEANASETRIFFGIYDYKVHIGT